LLTTERHNEKGKHTGARVVFWHNFQLITHHSSLFAFTFTLDGLQFYQFPKKSPKSSLRGSPRIYPWG
ncbi:MAG: hypothetical protein NWQ28_13505, partial [Nodularia sp. (in: cyanobacteria)]|nr:hypothetical protein [Nodularia sp. (in: cyanobacteria)]